MDNFELFDATGSTQGHHISLPHLGQRARHRRNPADMATHGINLILTDDTDRAFDSLAIAISNGRTEENLLDASARRINDLGDVETLGQKTNTTIDLAQAAFAILVIGVFRTVTI